MSRDALTGCPADPAAAAVAVYDTTADAYADDWDSYVPAALGGFAGRVGAGAVVLDAGCGPGRDLRALARLGVRPVGVDLSAGMCQVAARSGLPVQVGDLRRLPFPAATVAGVWASASLVHLSPADAGVAFGELARVTVPGGPAHVTVKAIPGHGQATGREGYGDAGRWFHYWTPGQAAAVAAGSGWAVERVDVDADSRRDDVSWVTLTLTA